MRLHYDCDPVWEERLAPLRDRCLQGPQGQCCSELRQATGLNRPRKEADWRRLEELAEEFRTEADLFILVGVGGSNQGARAVAEALRSELRGPEICYLGRGCSPEVYRRALERLDRSRSPYVQVIAKNFRTLEPGLAFRLLRDYMERRFGPDESRRRFVLTGSEGAEELGGLAARYGYRQLPFPAEAGGRFSVFTNVGLFPLAVAGLDVRAFYQAGRDCLEACAQGRRDVLEQVATAAAERWVRAREGYVVETLCFFEERLEALARWWRQLVGESEGKLGQGIFPSYCSFTEDLHSMGQYLQEGRPLSAELFLGVGQPGQDLVLPGSAVEDGFSHLAGWSLNAVNAAAQEATIRAHRAAGRPLSLVQLPSLGLEELGELLMFWMLTEVQSCRLFDLPAYNQPGVEAYKQEMQGLLRRSESGVRAAD